MNLNTNFYKKKYLKYKEKYLSLQLNNNTKLVGGSTVSDSTNSLILFVEQNNINKVTELINANVNINLNIINDKGYTALMIAIRKNFIDIVKLLINAGADLDIQDNEGDTALMMSARSNLIDIVKLLLDAGANVNIINTNISHRHNTAYKMAASNANWEVISLLDEALQKI